MSILKVTYEEERGIWHYTEPTISELKAEISRLLKIEVDELKRKNECQTQNPSDK